MSADATRAFLTDMYLIPGDHLLSITGDGGDYTLSLTALGAAPPDGEIEPNGDVAHAEPIAVGGTRTGRLPTMDDVDVSRFSLSATDHVAISVTSPADGAIRWALSRDDVDVTYRTPSPGTTDAYDAQLPAGDYTLRVSPITPSEGRYQLRIDRLDPFAIATDQEPDDGPGDARPVPADGVVGGTATVPNDEDWYQLGSLSDSVPLEIRADAGVSFAEVSDGTTGYPLTRDGESDLYRSDPLPSGVPLFLHLVAAGDYVVRIGHDGVFPQPAAPAPLPLDMALTAEPGKVAAFWSSGQRVAGSLSLTNTGADALDLRLDGQTSHYAWHAELGGDPIHLEPGATTSVPVPIVVQPDAWSDLPVRVTIRATDATGRSATTYTELTPDPDAPPLHAEQHWLVPDALLGGLDVASLALGAVPDGSLSSDWETSLHDGVTPVGDNYGPDPGSLPVTIERGPGR